LAEPLHWVIAAPVVDSKGLQPVVPPEPTHWFTVRVSLPGLISVKLFVTDTLHRSVPPPPLAEPSHWMTDVTGAARLVVVVVQKWPRAPSVGSPADPRHSWTVTTADPAVAVIVLTMVTSQMMPSPPALPTPVAHAPTGDSDSALARALMRSVTGPSIARAARPGRSSLKWRHHDALTERDAPRLGAAVAEPAATTARSICSMAISHPALGCPGAWLQRSRPLSDRRDIALHSTIGCTRLPPRGWNLAAAADSLDSVPPTHPLGRYSAGLAQRFWQACRRGPSRGLEEMQRCSAAPDHRFHQASAFVHGLTAAVRQVWVHDHVPPHRWRLHRDPRLEAALSSSDSFTADRIHAPKSEGCIRRRSTSAASLIGSRGFMPTP
jgi:hypothetical protein